MAMELLSFGIATDLQAKVRLFSTAENSPDETDKQFVALG